MFGDQNPGSGVVKKLFSQISELKQLGLDVELVLISTGDVHYPSYDRLTVYRADAIPVRSIFGWIKRARKISQIFNEVVEPLTSDDILYYRYASSFPLNYPRRYLRSFRPCKIVTEHQTKELDELKLSNNALTYWSDRLFGKLLRKQSDAIIGVTDEITQYELTRAGDPEKPHLTIGNGFAVQSVPIRQTPPHANHLHLTPTTSTSRQPPPPHANHLHLTPTTSTSSASRTSAAGTGSTGSSRASPPITKHRKSPSTSPATEQSYPISRNWPATSASATGWFSTAS